MFNKSFYPTPANIIDKMLMHIDFKLINTVLEPSAGKGDIVNKVRDKMKYSKSNYNKDIKYDIDIIEIDEDLQHILKGKNYRLVHNDFLNYNSYKKYDLIVMNPPFENGDKHLLKALQLQEKGGKIVCILNAETLKNPYTNIRRDLVHKLEHYNAKIEYIKDAFLDAERKTGIEIALIKINISKNNSDSIILNELKKEEQHRTIESNSNNNNNLINNDFIKGIVESYNFEVRAGLKLISEYRVLEPLMLNNLKKEENIYNNKNILELKLNNEDDSSTLENGYIKQMRIKYWRALFTSEQFIGLLTSNLREKYYNKVKELKNYDFSLYNIYSIKIQLNKEMIKGVEDTILNLFESLSHKYHYFNESSKNIHYYNGWKTNKAYKINKKVIIPLDAYCSWSGNYKPNDYKVREELEDIEKVFNYLDTGITEEINMADSLKFAKGYRMTKKIELKYFLVTFYKKGTCHIEFKDLELLHKFNLYGSQRKNWLPPNYGKVKYNNMTNEEQQIINEFEGEISYNKVMNNKDYYFVESSKLLMISS